MLGLVKWRLGIGKPPHDLVERRRELCAVCPERTERNTCKVCGCYLPAKTELARESCPLEKW